jgi:uncharacterized protein (TIGR00252 family)
MSTKLGRQAEQAVCNWLIRQSFEIIATNWRTRYCEIDIIAKRSNKLYFVEVKYRGSSRFGGGLEYITPRKQNQMAFSADIFEAKYSTRLQRIICAVSVGPKFEVEEYVEIEV